MPEPARDATLILLTIAYLGGAVLTLAKVLLAWSTSWRPDKDPDPGDIDALQQLAAKAMGAVASRASVAAPTVDVVAVLGVPLANSGGPVTGDGGLAVTRFRVGREHYGGRAAAALTGLSPAAVHSLAAHELAHVMRRERSSAAGRYVWLAGYLVLMVAGAGLSVTAPATAPR